MKKWILASPLLALVTGCSASAVTHNVAAVPNIKQIFLNYVPPNEPVAPHDMEWIVEHQAGYGGYYGTKYFPGTIKVTPMKNWHYYVQTYDGKNVFAQDAYDLIWKIGGLNFEFTVFPISKTDSNGLRVATNKWDISPANQDAQLLAAVIYGA